MEGFDTAQKPFIKVLDVERVIDIFHKLAVRTTYALPSRPSSLCCQSLSFSLSVHSFLYLLYTPRRAHTLTHFLSGALSV